MSATLDFTPFERITLLEGPTPIQRLDRFERDHADALCGVHLYVKRDDHMLLGGGGNKLRKLEFLLGQARAAGADTVITVGGLQSNHARLTAAAAAYCGLKCELVLARMVPREDIDYERGGNVMLDALFGARIHVPAGSDGPLAWAEQRAAELRREGRIVAVIPSGGSTPIGSLGYAACAQEIKTQAAERGVAFSQVVVPNGSSGTHAGLLAGFAALGVPATMVRSYAVLADVEPTANKTLELASATAALLKAPVALTREDINLDGGHRGQAYGVPTTEMVDAVRALARSEGLLLDPVYSGKAFAGLLADIRAQRFSPGENVLFVMTGGTPGLYAYRTAFEA